MHKKKSGFGVNNNNKHSDRRRMRFREVVGPKIIVEIIVHLQN